MKRVDMGGPVSHPFYGVPGAGKASVLQAIAGHCGRSISAISDSGMTDFMLRCIMVSGVKFTAQRYHISALNRL